MIVFIGLNEIIFVRKKKRNINWIKELNFLITNLVKPFESICDQFVHKKNHKANEIKKKGLSHRFMITLHFIEKSFKFNISVKYHDVL